MEHLGRGVPARLRVQPPGCLFSPLERGSALTTRHRLFAAAVAATMLGGSVTVPVSAADPAPSTTTLWVDNLGHDLQDNHPFALIAAISPADVEFATDATIDFVDLDGHGPSCLAVALDPGNETTCQVDDPAAGTYRYQATYSGNATLDASQSSIVEVVVEPDTVEADHIGVSLGTFFPSKDGYRDTVRIAGHRSEAITVAIRIYNPDNKRVKSVTRALDTGSYGYTWNGRTSSGKLLPAGRYRVVQALVDAAGTSKAVTRYVTLSHKRLVTRTASVTKLGKAASAGSGNLKYNSAGTMSMKAGTNDAVAGWQLKIPSAVIYKRVAFRVDAAAPYAAPPTLIAMQNFNWCKRSSSWSASCFNRVKDIGSSSGSRRWYAVKGSVTANRSGQYVRGLVYVSSGRVLVYRVQVEVVYQVLR